jgi:hypothetical protein
LSASAPSQAGVGEGSSRALKTAFPPVTLISQPDSTAFSASSPDVYSLASLGQSQAINANNTQPDASTPPAGSNLPDANAPASAVSSDTAAPSAFAADYSSKSGSSPGQNAKQPQNAEERLKEIEGQSASTAQGDASAKKATVPGPQTQGSGKQQRQGSAPATSTTSSEAKAGSAPKSPSTGFSPEQLKQIAALSARDRQVRTHEQQHQAAGGSLAGSASFTFETGPDGVQYAVGGEVPIDLSTVPGDPAQTISRMEIVRSAALAPADPSAADRAAAATATRIILQAQSDLLAKNNAERLAQIKKASQAATSDTTNSAGSASNSKSDNATSTNGQSKSQPGSNLPDQADKIGSAIYKGVKAYQNFIKSQDQSPLSLSQIV